MNITLEPSTLDRIEEYRREHGLPDQAAAILELIELALEQEPD